MKWAKEHGPTGPYHIYPLRYLRSDVVGCSTEGLGGDAIVHVLFAHAKVCNLDVTLTVQHHIVQLQVSAE